MVSGLVSFEEIVEHVKDETGYPNMRPYYERIKRLLFRAEKEIGYGGSIILKKAIYIKGENGFDGQYVKYPVDYIEHEGIGNCSGPFRHCEYSYRPEGIRMLKSQDKVVLVYWGLFCDGYGNPVTTRNHFEAVVAYIVWKMYSSKVFLGIGNMNAKKDYQYMFENALGASRGFDAMPTTEEWTGIGHLTYQWIGELIMFPTAGFNYCDDTIQQACFPVTEQNVVNMKKVYFWQETNPVTVLQDVADEVDADPVAFFADKNNEFFSVFAQGRMCNWTTVGKIGFAIQETENMNWQLLDSLNNDITDLFETYYHVGTKSIIFVSIENYTYSSIYYKFKEL